MTADVHNVADAPGKWLPPIHDNIPSLLQQYDRWLLWTLNGEGRKVPRAVKRPERDCDSTKPVNWCSFKTLIAAPRQLDGPGFALGPVDNGPTFAGVDLDDCRNPVTGVIEPWAWDIIRSLNSYAEISPSRTGVKIFSTGTLSDDLAQDKVYKLEIYDHKRYFTVTGHHLEGTPRSVEPCEEQLRALHARQRSGDLVELTKLFGLYGQDRGSWIDITCPWADEHSQDDGPRDAALHLDADGHVSGFHCFHASHSEAKKLPDVLRRFGLKGVHSGFVLNAKQQPAADNQENVRRAVAKLNIQLTHDVFAQKLLATQNGHTGPFEDPLLNRCWLLIDEQFKFRPSFEFFEKVMTDTARQHPFHPIRDYLKTLTWDGTPRIDTWLAAYGGATDNVYVRAVGALVLTAAVKRVIEPGCKFDEMLILESATQGVLKSTALRTLCPKDEWFSDDLPLNVDAKQIIERTSGKWIIEASDLSGMRASQVEHLKAMLSRQVDGPCRMAYDRLPKEQPRHFIIIGTTNAMTGYLKDTTGARRFWPVHVEKFDVEALKKNRDQLWAEAFVRAQMGASIRLPEHLYPNAAREQEHRRHVDAWEELLAEFIDSDNPPAYIETADVWMALGVGANSRDNRQAQRVTEIMQRLGYPCKRQCRRGGKKSWFWLNADEAEQEELFDRRPSRPSFITTKEDE